MDYYTAYNENGDLAKFEIDEGKVKCGHCGKIYYQERHEQVPGFREVDDDICPYCHESNGRSGDWEFFNRKIED